MTAERVVIRAGPVVDGSGGEPYVADNAVKLSIPSRRQPDIPGSLLRRTERHRDLGPLGVVPAGGLTALRNAKWP
jgi:hypothetical protein